ncbi:DUF4065 domain-containing protein, partial [Pseudoxanthomonas sp. SGD-10]
MASRYICLSFIKANNMEITLAQDKAFNALLYFAERIQPLYLTKAIKLLYIADERAIRDSGVPITWLNYKAWKFGPVPEEIYDRIKTIDYLQKSGQEVTVPVQIAVTQPTGNLPDGIILQPKREFDDSQFSDYEIEILDDVIQDYGKLTGEQLVDILHQQGSLWHKVVQEHHLEQQFELKNNRSDFVIELTQLLDSDFKKSA